MAGVQQNYDASSGDTVVSRNPSEKVPAEAPLPGQEADHEMSARREDDIEEVNGDQNGGQIEKQPSGTPLDRTPSQAQRMGKKKIIVVMAALCVRLLGVLSEDQMED